MGLGLQAYMGVASVLGQQRAQVQAVRDCPSQALLVLSQLPIQEPRRDNKPPLLLLQASELGEDRAALQGRLSAFLDHNPRGTVLITNVHKARAAWAGGWGGWSHAATAGWAAQNALPCPLEIWAGTQEQVCLCHAALHSWMRNMLRQLQMLAAPPLLRSCPPR